MKRPDLLRHREVFIHSMEVLIGRYERAMEKGISKMIMEMCDGDKCLLCHPIGISENRIDLTKDSDDSGCIALGCPWMVMDGLACFPSARGFQKRPAYNSTNPTVQQARIDQIREWIEAYKNFEEA